MSNVIETPATHDTAAGEMLVQLRNLAQTIKGYGFSTKGQRRRLTTFATLPIPFMLEVAVALDASPAYAQHCGITGAQIREIVQFANAYAPVGSELVLVGTGVNDTVQVQLAEAGRLCLRAYRLAKGFHSPTDRELLMPHFAEMQRLLKRGRPSRVRAKPPETPAPAPKPETAKS